MNSNEDKKKLNKKELKQQQNEFKKDQYKFKEINKDLESHIVKLDEINSKMEIIGKDKFTSYDRIYKTKEFKLFNEAKEEISNLKENTLEIKNLNEGNIVRQKPNMFSKTKKFIKDNRKTIDNYLITPALTIASIPAGMLYASRKKSASEKFAKLVIGMYASVILTGAVAWMNYSEPQTTIYENNNIEIIYENSYSPANHKSNYTFLDYAAGIITWTGSNYYLFEEFKETKYNNITKLNIHSKENKSSISANYEFEGFKTIEELNLEELNNPKKLNVNGYSVDKYYTNRQTHIDEIKQIYKENEPKINTKLD